MELMKLELPEESYLRECMRSHASFLALHEGFGLNLVSRSREFNYGTYASNISLILCGSKIEIRRYSEKIYVLQKERDWYVTYKIYVLIS
jgi:hypothetical protein